jgi:regulator of replication initiation timing
MTQKKPMRNLGAEVRRLEEILKRTIEERNALRATNVHLEKRLDEAESGLQLANLIKRITSETI